MIRIFISLLTLFLVSQNLCAQDWSASYKRGFLINQRIGHLINGFPQGFAVERSVRKTGSSYWHKALGFPTLSLKLTYLDYANPTIGQTFTISRSMRIPIITREKLDFSFNGALGGAYATNPYHPITNNKNNALGSHFVFHLIAGLALDYQPWDNIRLFSRLMIDHHSNGALSMPNTGANQVNLEAGIGYRPRSLQLPEAETNPPEDYGSFSFVAGSGLMDVLPPGFGPFPFLNTYFFYGHTFKGIHQWNVGLDLNFSRGYQFLIQEGFKLDGKEKPDYRRASLIAGYELKLDRYSILYFLGYYFYKPYDVDRDLNQRYGVKYYFNDWLFGSFSMKTHLFVAEQVEFGLGICLRK